MTSTPERELHAYLAAHSDRDASERREVNQFSQSQEATGATPAPWDTAEPMCLGCGGTHASTTCRPTMDDLARGLNVTLDPAKFGLAPAGPPLHEPTDRDTEREVSPIEAMLDHVGIETPNGVTIEPTDRGADNVPSDRVAELDQMLTAVEQQNDWLVAENERLRAWQREVCDRFGYDSEVLDAIAHVKALCDAEDERVAEANARFAAKGITDKTGRPLTITGILPSLEVRHALFGPDSIEPPCPKHPHWRSEDCLPCAFEPTEETS